MAQQESRFLRQCTYTPVENRPDMQPNHPGFAPSTPLLKNALLGVAFSDRDLGEILLGCVALRARERGATISLSVAEALDPFWRSDVAGVVTTLANIPTQQVIEFARLALECEAELLDESVRTAAQHLEELASQDSDTDRSIDERLDRFRRSILDDVAELRASTARTEGANPDEVLAFRPGSGSAPPGDSPEIKHTITREDIQHRLEERAPRVASFLAASGFFASQRYVSKVVSRSLTQLDAFRAVRLHAIQQKQGVLLSIESTLSIEPIGYLHLERLDFEPVGYVRGDLVYTLPLLPHETVRLTHREWSRTETEYVTLVSDSLEAAAEEAVSDNSELTESFGSEREHSSAFNVSTSASGSYGPVSVSTSVGYSAQNSESQSREFSAHRTKEVTRSASSRSKREHKVTFQIATEAELEDTSHREITNTTNEAVRWDYYRLLRQWKVSLYRYGLRLTYDVVVPEPGSYLLRRYIELQAVEDALLESLQVDLQPHDITRDSWEDLAAAYQTALEPPPDANVSRVFFAEQSFSSKTVGQAYLEVSFPAGYHFAQWYAEGSALARNGQSAGYVNAEVGFNTARLNAGARLSNTYSWRYHYDWSEPQSPTEGSTLTVMVWVRGELTEMAMQEWQARNYERLTDKASTDHENRRLRLTSIRDALIAETARVQGLSLRKLEQEEIMKAVLRWVLGPDFSFYPADLPQLTLDSVGDLGYYDSATQVVQTEYFEPTLRHGEYIRFLHQAIEWENVNYVLYPYFWTDDYRWDFKQALYHGDTRHNDFLRAGAARVVLTVRPGFEESFLALMETGVLGDDLPSGHPYISVANELKAIASTNYPYTPGPHDDDPSNKVDEWMEFTPTAALDVGPGPVS